jgi:glutamyl-tRNA synthetase
MKQLPPAELAAKVQARLSARHRHRGRPRSEKAVIPVRRPLQYAERAGRCRRSVLRPCHAQPGTAGSAPGDEARPALADFAAGIANVAWEAPAINALIKETVTKHGLKMPKLAMPLRVILTGQAQTPSVDAVIVLIGRDKVTAAAGAKYLRNSGIPIYKDSSAPYNAAFFRGGGIAQLGERLHGMQEVRGSIPRTSTKSAKEDSPGPHRLEA